MALINLFKKLKGGPGSGNFGHSGRPGKVGGSNSNINSLLIQYVTESRYLNKDIKNKIKEVVQKSTIKSQPGQIYRIESEDPRYEEGEVVNLDLSSFTKKDITTGESAGNIGWKSRDEAIVIVRNPKKGLEIDYNKIQDKIDFSAFAEEEVLLSGRYKVMFSKRITEPGTHEQYEYTIPLYVLEEL